MDIIVWLRHQDHIFLASVDKVSPFEIRQHLSAGYNVDVEAVGHLVGNVPNISVVGVRRSHTVTIDRDEYTSSI